MQLPYSQEPLCTHAHEASCFDKKGEMNFGSGGLKWVKLNPEIGHNINSYRSIKLKRMDKFESQS